MEIDTIDDYIEPQLIIQAKAKEIAAMTLRKDWNGAFNAVVELQDAAEELESWLRFRITIE